MNFFKEKEEEDGGEAGEGRGARATNTAVLKQNRARRQHGKICAVKLQCTRSPEQHRYSSLAPL